MHLYACPSSAGTPTHPTLGSLQPTFLPSRTLRDFDLFDTYLDCTMTRRERSPPRELPAIGTAEVLPADQLLDEEGFSWYDPEKWYPVRIGDIIKAKFQILVKLGFGSVSTVWLCRDLECAAPNLAAVPGHLSGTD